jgi:Domain of unknown function (DUF3576)
MGAHRKIGRVKVRKILALGVLGLLSGCSQIRNDMEKQMMYGTGAEGLTRKVDERKGSHPVNAFLWRASLDAVGATPLEIADPKEGLIVTDWHASPSSPDDRLKLRIHVLDSDMRPDTFRVSAARQIKKGGSWVNVSVPATITRQLEDTILTKARDMRRTTFEE